MKETYAEMVNVAYDRLNAAVAELRTKELTLVEAKTQLANETAEAHRNGLIDGKNQQARDAAERMLMGENIRYVTWCEIAVANAKLEYELATNERRRVDALLVIAQLV